MQASTKAQRDHASERRLYPSAGGADQMTRAWAYFSRTRWSVFKASYPELNRTHCIVLGLPEPYANTEHYPDCSALVRVNDGLISFVQSFCLALMTGSNVATSDGRTEAARAAPERVNQALLALYEQWKAIWAGSDLKPPPVLPGNMASAIADSQFVLCLLFVLMHEYGHAVLHRGQEPAPEREHEADIWALDAIMSLFGVPTRQPRVTLAGAGIYLRLQAALERLHLAAQRPPEYPSPDARMQRIAQQLATRWCQDEFDYYDMTTVLYANDIRLETAERALGGENYLAPVRSDRLISLIMSLLIELSEGRPRSMSAINHELDRATVSVLSEAGIIARRVFATTQKRYLEVARDGPYVKSRVDSFWSLVGQMPPKVQLHFKG
jgi:hypothetical protein